MKSPARLCSASRVILAFGTAAAIASTGCGATCDRSPDEPPVVFSQGSSDLEAGFYETGPLDGPFLDFPKGRTYRLTHGFEAQPFDIDTCLAFDRSPDECAEGAGNQVTIELGAMTDDYFEIRNDTCSDVYLRVVALFRRGSARDGG